MKTILITTNNNKNNISILVSLHNNLIEEINNLQYLGGFLRFNLEVYSDKKEINAKGINELNLFLKKHVFIK